MPSASSLTQSGTALPPVKKKSAREAENPGPSLLSPIECRELAFLLDGYKDREFIVKSFEEGFSLCFNGVPSSVEGRNALSVRRNPLEALKKVDGERALGRISGPFTSKPCNPFKCSPLSLRPKSTPGKFRLLHDLSFPYNDEAVNQGITDEDAKVKYSSVQDAVKILVKHPGIDRGRFSGRGRGRVSTPGPGPGSRSAFSIR